MDSSQNQSHLTKIGEKKKIRHTFIILTVVVANIPKRGALRLLVFHIGGMNINHAGRDKEADRITCVSECRLFTRKREV